VYCGAHVDLVIVCEPSPLHGDGVGDGATRSDNDAEAISEALCVIAAGPKEFTPPAAAAAAAPAANVSTSVSAASADSSSPASPASPPAGTAARRQPFVKLQLLLRAVGESVYDTVSGFYSSTDGAWVHQDAELRVAWLQSSRRTLANASRSATAPPQYLAQFTQRLFELGRASHEEHGASPRALAASLYAVLAYVEAGAAELAQVLALEKYTTPPEVPATVSAGVDVGVATVIRPPVNETDVTVPDPPPPPLCATQDVLPDPSVCRT
jgi:hypothetical protein